MKKTLFVLFAVLVLICAVACSSSPKEVLTGVQIDTTAIKDAKRVTTAASAKLVYFSTTALKIKEIEGIELPVSLTDVANGSVFAEMEPGVYHIDVYFYDDAGDVKISNSVQEATEKR